MTTILVAVDFSANFHRVTQYALELARQLRGRLVLVHAYDPFVNAIRPAAWMVAKAQEQQEQLIHQLSALRNQLLEVTDCPVDNVVLARPGSPISALIDEAVNQKADLLVMEIGDEQRRVARELDHLAVDILPPPTLPSILVFPAAAYQKLQTIELAVNPGHPDNSISTSLFSPIRV